jgi:hypothetical protein
MGNFSDPDIGSHENRKAHGKLWWIGLTTGSGLLIGLLKRPLRYPVVTDGFITEIQDRYVNFRHSVRLKIV